MPVEVVKVPGVNHLLVPAKTGDVSEYGSLGPDAKVAPQVTSRDRELPDESPEGLSRCSGALLIRITGHDRPGLTHALASILARYDARILDIGQAVIHDGLALGILIEMTESAAIVGDPDRPPARERTSSASR